MLGIGLVLVLYLLGRRFGPAQLGADGRMRFLAVWVIPPLAVYVFAHLGEPGYVLSLAPQAAILISLAIGELHAETAQLCAILRARGLRWLPRPRWAGLAVAIVLATAIVGWNGQAFARGVGPGRLPDLRAHDATTSAQIEFVRTQPAATTLVLAHDILRQAQFYLPGYHIELLFSEYVPDFMRARTRTALPAGVAQIVVLDGPLEPDAPVREVRLREQPVGVSVWLLDATGAQAVEHGYHYVHLID
jgi:hypothetical protein